MINVANVATVHVQCPPSLSTALFHVPLASQPHPHVDRPRTLHSHCRIYHRTPRLPRNARSRLRLALAASDYFPPADALDWLYLYRARSHTYTPRCVGTMGTYSVRFLHYVGTVEDFWFDVHIRRNEIHVPSTASER